jgi:hypothetical protein
MACERRSGPKSNIYCGCLNHIKHVQCTVSPAGLLGLWRPKTSARNTTALGCDNSKSERKQAKETGFTACALAHADNLLLCRARHARVMDRTQQRVPRAASHGAAEGYAADSGATEAKQKKGKETCERTGTEGPSHPRDKHGTTARGSPNQRRLSHRQQSAGIDSPPAG